MPFDDHRNFSIATVATPPTPPTSGTLLVVATGTGSRFPTTPFNASIWPAGTAADPTNAEIVRVTAITDDIFTLTRAQEGSTARALLAGDQIAATITDKTLTDIEAVATLGSSAVAVLDRSVTLVDIVNTTTETTVYSATVPGGTLGTNGFVELIAQGEILTTVGTPLLVIKVKYGGVAFALGTQGMAANPVSYALRIHAYLSASGSPSAQRGSGELVLGLAGSMQGGGSAMLNFAQSVTGNSGLTVDSSVAQPVIITFQWGTALTTASAKLHTAHLLRGM